MTCIFCQIVSEQSPCHKVWEDEKHLAFLSIFPNTEGVTVVIPKLHYSSYVFDLPDEVYSDLLVATRKVGKLLDSKLGTGRTALVFEGFGVDHVHAKLFPLHGTNLDSWQPIKSNINTFFEIYPGYVSTHDAARANDEELAILAKKISGWKRK